MGRGRHSNREKRGVALFMCSEPKNEKSSITKKFKRLFNSGPHGCPEVAVTLMASGPPYWRQQYMAGPGRGIQNKRDYLK